MGWILWITQFLSHNALDTDYDTVSVVCDCSLLVRIHQKVHTINLKQIYTRFTNVHSSFLQPSLHMKCLHTTFWHQPKLILLFQNGMSILKSVSHSYSRVNRKYVNVGKRAALVKAFLGVFNVPECPFLSQFVWGDLFNTSAFKLKGHCFDVVLLSRRGSKRSSRYEFQSAHLFNCLCVYVRICARLRLNAERFLKAKLLYKFHRSSTIMSEEIEWRPEINPTSLQTNDTLSYQKLLTTGLASDVHVRVVKFMMHK